MQQRLLGFHPTPPSRASANAPPRTTTACAVRPAMPPPAGEWLIVTAAGGALGRMALAYARSLGVRTIATVRRPQQVAALREAG